MTVLVPTEAELQFYYFGFYRALKRYRTVTLIGWSVVLTGCASVPLGWNIGGPGGLIELTLSGFTILAGLALVWQSVTSLDEYARIPYPSRQSGNGNGETPAVLGEIIEIMRDVADGGWQEAYAGLRKLKELGTKHGVRSLE